MPPQNTPSHRSIIIDTCVIQAAGHSKEQFKSKAILDCLTNFKKEGFNLVISEVTFYENLQGLWGKRAEQANILLTKFETKVVSREVLKTAAYLGGLYSQDKILGVSTCDKIIAATAFLEFALIFTENHRHFPPPFLTQNRYVPLRFQKDHYQRTMDLALYESNVHLINRRISESNKL